MKFFSFDPNGEGYQRHKTAEEAKTAALKALEDERDIANSDGWDEDVFLVCWGEIKQSVKEVAGVNGRANEMFCDSRTTDCQLVDA